MPKPILVERPSSSREVHAVVKDEQGVVPEHLYGEMGTNEWTEVAVPISYYMLSWTIPDHVPFGSRASLLVKADGCQDYTDEIALVPDVPGTTVVNLNITIKRASAHHGRPGLVRSNAGIYYDDLGEFRPKVTTFFAVPYWWRQGDRDRMLQHFEYFASFGVQATRILGDVNWEGQVIDSSWPDWEQIMGEIVDVGYDRYGIRQKITLWGSIDSPRDPVIAAGRLNAVCQGRQHKIYCLEAANEGNLDLNDAIAVVKALRGSGVPLVSVGLGNQDIDEIKRATSESGASKIDFHTERNEPPERQVRQAWNFKEFQGLPVSNAEPPGIHSSVAEMTDPFIAGTFRTMSIICGAGAFCIHLGEGVYLKVNRDRAANVWEAPGADAMYTQVCQAGDWLPAGIENWPKYNEKYKSMVYIEGGDKCYGASDGLTSVFLGTALSAGSTITANAPIHARVLHPVTGVDIAAHVMAEGTTVPGPTGLWAYAVLATRR